MSRTIDLIWLGAARAPRWEHGQVVLVPDATPACLAGIVARHLVQTKAAALCFRDSELGPIPEECITSFLESRDDLQHAGLLLGMGGLPWMLDFIQPTWMLNRDPDPSIEATSWRLSLRTCLVRTDVMRQLGGPDGAFTTLAAASLEMGHRYIQNGVLMRHVPGLYTGKPETTFIPAEDELRFALRRFGRKWAFWALGRAWMSPHYRAAELMHAWRRIRSGARLPADRRIVRALPEKPSDMDARVSVLIPTLDRYEYLRKLLAQLRDQTIRPHEVILIDQTPVEQRDQHLATDFPDLSLVILTMDSPGQCSSRNAGIERARGDYILMADDDIEIYPTFIEDHLTTMDAFQADSSSGIAFEVGIPLPTKRDTMIRVSDVFPAGITMLRRESLTRSGLFDLAYERGQRADGDLGMRLYLSGARMILNPNIAVIHHRAPRGGLRAHRARVVTRSSSRTRLLQRHLPSVSEIYLIKRYFSPHQVRESLLARMMGTLTGEGSAWRKGLKMAAGLFTMPHSASVIRKRAAIADQMFGPFPHVPPYNPARAHAPHEAVDSVH